MLFVAGHRGDSRCCCCICCAAEGQDEAEGVFAVQVEAVETFLRDKTERSIQRESGRVVELGLECDLLCATSLHNVDRMADERRRYPTFAVALVDAEHRNVSPEVTFAMGRLLADYYSNGMGFTLSICKEGEVRPLVEEVTIRIDDVRLRELPLDERDDVREFVFSTVCAVGDCVHG